MAKNTFFSLFSNLLQLLPSSFKNFERWVNIIFSLLFCCFSAINTIFLPFKATKGDDFFKPSLLSDKVFSLSLLSLSLPSSKKSLSFSLSLSLSHPSFEEVFFRRIDFPVSIFSLLYLYSFSFSPPSLSFPLPRIQNSKELGWMEEQWRSVIGELKEMKEKSTEQKL